MDYDVAVVGGGPAGYVAAIRCAQQGLDTVCIERWLDPENQPVLGGTCLNVGCIPSKALLESSHHYAFIKNHAHEHGLNAGGVSVDMHRMLARKDRIVRSLSGGIAGLLKKNKVGWIQGSARLLGDGNLTITAHDNDDKAAYTLSAKHIVLATGSQPASLPIVHVDNNMIVDSTAALSFDHVPRRLGIIGAGAIGLELGSVWNRLGAEVVVLEALESFLAGADRTIAEQSFKAFTRQGLDIRLGASVLGVASNNQQVIVTYEENGTKERLICDRLIVAVGRKPNLEGLGADELGLALDQRRGFIKIDEKYRTNLPGVYAIGDVVGGPMLAHKASAEGEAVAALIANGHGCVNYATVPWVIYTWPEIAWVGKSEHDLTKKGIPYDVGQFTYSANGRAKTMGENEGVIKVLIKKETGLILGVHIFGACASEIIAEAVTIMEFDGNAEDLSRIVHAHPTLSEGLHEAAFGALGRGLHV